MKYIVTMIAALLLMAACGQSYEETKRINRENRREAMRRDSAALKIAVMPTLDCLPLYVARHHRLLDTLEGGVRLKYYTAQMDCDTALERGRVEGAVRDLVRASRMVRRGTKLRYATTTNAYWQLVSSRSARIRQLKQLDDKMIAMTRYSATDLLTDRVVDSVKLDGDRVFKVQVNDVLVRLLMLQNGEADAFWMTEPQATAARTQKNPVIADSRSMGVQLGVIVFREQEMRRQARGKQLALLMKAYDQACDSINKYGIGHYRRLISECCKMSEALADSLPRTLRFHHAEGPREQDLAAVEQWIKKGGM